MKLHLPTLLRKALLCAFSLVTTLGTSNTYAAGLHSQVGMVTYTDFGQNMGRYRVNGVNDLLSSIRERDGGVSIYYQEGHDDFLLPHYMISYESQGDNGAYAAVGYNFIATVAHNACQNPTFTGRYINGTDSLHYYGVEYRGNITFGLLPGDSNWSYDFKMTRLNKLITDVTTSDLMPRFPDDYDYSQLHGLMEYRAGAGAMSIRHLDRSSEGLTGAYAYVTGAVQTITTGGTANQEWACFTAGGILDPTAAGINDTAPLPFVGEGGDSGSPVWLWDDESQSYLYLAAFQSGSDWFGQARGSINFTWDSLTKFDKLIDMEQGASRTVHIKGVTATDEDEVVSDGTHTTRLHLGRVTDAGGSTITTYVGVKGDDDRYINTWLNLAPLKDQASWFATNNKYYNVGSYTENGVTTRRELDIEDLFNDSNLVFSASTETGNVVAVDEDADLGIGYLQFSIDPESHLTHAEFTLQSNGKTADGHGGQRDYLLNSAGFVVEKGVDLHVQLTNTQWDSDANDYYYREWRKVGDGNLYLEGSGDNQIFLNVGGPGTTYLKEQGGYAAYNVYAASGATVVLENADVGQIYRDFTFGYTGATLDFNGAGQMDWLFSANAVADGFNIHSQSEDGIITNGKAGTLFTLTYKESGTHEYIGSFVDSADGGALKVVFDGGTGSKLTLHSIHTDLQNADSGITVNSGNIVLSGTNTKHAMGSRSGRNAERYFSAEDWHFADTKADVLVKAGATFTLGSHARLKGDVTLEQNASLVISEGVLNTNEYIEGGIRKEDVTTDFYRQFYGLHGDIKTVAGSSVSFDFAKATTAEQVYAGSITGGANVSVSLGGSGATLRLSGENSDYSGTKELTGGGLISDNGLAPLGTVTSTDADGNAWHVAADAYIAAKGAAGEELLELVRQDSKGVLALTQTQETDLKLQAEGYNGLIVGALAGQENVRYGTENAELSTVQNGEKAQWLLGGGGGNLIVDFILRNGNADLVLGNEYTTGSVTLTNEQNLIGSIIFKGQVTLDYTSEAALGQANISLNYTNRLKLLSEGGLARVTDNSNGVVLVDKAPDAAFNLTDHRALYLGASVNTTLLHAPTVAAGSAYRFGGIEGVLTLAAALQDSGGQATGLIVDGQTFSGGVLELAQAAGITGAVEVRGYDSDLLPQGVQPHGDITLRLTKDDALKQASGVTLKDGGILDVYGTSQTLHNLRTEDGSLVTSSEAGGTLTVEVDADSTIAGVLDLYRVNKRGSGTLELSGSSLVDMFDVQEGTLRVTAADALSGMVAVHSGGILELPGGSVNAILSLGDGALVRVTQNATATLGGMVLEDGATATLQGGTLALPRQATIGSTGTTLKLTGNANLTLSADENMAIQSMLQATGNTTSKVSVSGGSADAHYMRVFDGIIVDQGSTLTLEQTVQETAPTYEIHDLSGQGTLVLSQGNYKNQPAFYKLTRDTEFAGTFKILGNTGYSSHKYMSYTLIQSDNALANAQVQMQGWGNDTGFFTLGIDTENASIKGLSTVSNDHSILMAGATTAATAENISVSSRRATLTITGSEDKVFAGQVVGGEEGTDNGLSIVMNGTGVQTFSGVSVFNDVSALQGTLKITNTSADSSIKGDITVARGANLTISKGYSLNEGKTLHVLGNAADVASLSTALTLAGGTIEFSCAQLGSETPALRVSSIVAGSVSIGFTDTESLEERGYLLSNGNWVGSSVDGLDLQYLNAEFNGTADGLYVTFSAKDGFHVWAGTADSNSWSGTKFGPNTVTFSNTETAVFNDAAQVKDVHIGSDNTAAQLIFDSSQQYTVGNDGSHVVTAATLHHTGSGTTVVNGGVQVDEIQLDAGELLVRDAALLDVATVSGNGTLGIDLGEGTAINLPALGEDGIGALRLVSGTLNVTETLNVTREAFVEEKATLNASTATFLKSGVSLHLAGNLTLNLTGNLNTSITGIDDRVGTLVLSGGSVTVDKAAALQVGTLDIRQGTMVVRRDGDSVREIGTLQLGNGAEFRVYGDTQPTAAMEFDLLEMSGSSAKVSNQNNSEAMVFRSLSSSADFTTLNLEKMANSTRITLFEFGGAQEPASDFTGKLVLSSTAGGGKRSAVIVLDDAQVAANAAINLASASSGDAILGLGVNADTVNIAGLESGSSLGSSARVFSGAVAVNADSSDSVFNGDGVDRELIITTAEGSDHTFYGAIGQNVRLTIAGMGVQRFSGEVVSHDLNLVGGTTAIAAGKYTGHANVNTGAELRFEGSHTVVSNRIETTGTVTLAGDHAVLELADDGDLEFQGFSYRDIDGYESPDVNGFALGGSVKLFNKGVGASINMGTSSIVYQGNTLVLGEDGIARLDAGDSYTYYVRKGRVTYDETFASKPSAAGITTFLLISAQAETPAELDIIQDLPDSVVVHSIGSGGILRLGENVSLSASQVDAQASITLAGSGCLELKGTASLQQDVSLGENWTGTVRVRDFSPQSAKNLGALVNGTDSVLELMGFNGWGETWNGSINYNVKLTDGSNGYAWQNGAFGQGQNTAVFTGTWSGTGLFRVVGATSNRTMHYTYSGNIAGWRGEFQKDGKQVTNLTFMGNASEVNIDITHVANAADLNVIAGDGSTAFETVFNGDVAATSMTVKANASATLAGYTVIGKNISNSGTLTNVGTLELGNITSWSGTLVNAAQGNVVITSKLTAGTIDNSGTITISDLMVGSDARYEDAHGQSSVNGFATSNLDVCAIGVIQNHGGTIMCGTRDVTDEVLGTGRVQDATTHAAYHVNSTDNTVSFSVIDAAADGALEHIAYADGTALKVDNTADGRHLHSSQLSGTGTITLQLQDGAVLEMDSAFTTKLEVASGASATLHVTENATSNTLTGLASGRTLAIDGDSSSVLTLAGASSVQGNLFITHSTVKMGNVQSLGAYNRITSIDTPLQRTITVGEQGVLDVNGGETSGDVGYTVTLDGGTLTNTGGDKNYGKRQPVTNLILDSDSKVVAQKTFGLVASSHAATTLALNGNTLEKTGDGTFFIVNSTVDAGDGGRIKVSEGMLNFNGTETGKRGTMEGTLELAGGNVAGHINLGGDTTFDATAASSDVTADIATNGHDVHFAGDGNISVHAHSNNTGENGSGAISGSGTIVKEGAGTTDISGSVDGFNGSIEVQAGIMEIMNAASVNVQDVTISNGTLGVYKDGTAAEANEGTITIKDTKTLTAGKNATLNANLVMEAGSTLDVRGTGGTGLLMGSDVTLSKGMTLNDYSGDWATWKDGTTYTLFTGVDGLDIGNGVTTGTMDYTQWVDAKEYFDNIQESNRYFLCYGGAPDQNAQGVLTAVNNGSNVGMVYIMTMPEPATSTLSLLALAALAARRRRR